MILKGWKINTAVSDDIIEIKAELSDMSLNSRSSNQINKVVKLIILLDTHRNK